MVLLSHYLFNYPIFCDKAWLCHTYTTSGCHFSKESQLGARQQKQILDNLIRTEWIKRYWVAHFIQKAEEPGLEATKQEIIPKIYKTGPKRPHTAFTATQENSLVPHFLPLWTVDLATGDITTVSGNWESHSGCHFITDSAPSLILCVIVTVKVWHRGIFLGGCITYVCVLIQGSHKKWESGFHG